MPPKSVAEKSVAVPAARRGEVATNTELDIMSKIIYAIIFYIGWTAI